MSRVKQESSTEAQRIKDEPDDFDLFGTIDTILDERPQHSHHAGILNNAKKEETTSDSSDSESEYEEVHERKRRSKHSRRLSEFRDFDMK